MDRQSKILARSLIAGLLMTLFSQQLGKFRQPLRVCRPRRSRYQIAIDVGLIDTDVGKVPASQLYFGGAGRVGAAGSAFQYTGGGQQLWAVTDGGDRLACRVKGGRVADLRHGTVYFCVPD